MSPKIPVRSLRIEATSGTTCYPGENGFFGAWAEITDDDAELVSVLEQHAKQRDPVTVTCGILEVTGAISRRESGKACSAFVVRIQGIRYGTSHVA